jgi:hypothetical protein
MKIAVDIRSLGSGNMTGIGHYLYNSLSKMIAKDKSVSWQLLNTGLKTNKPVFDQELNSSHLRLPNKIINAASVFQLDHPSLIYLIDVDLLWLPNIFLFPKKIFLIF